VEWREISRAGGEAAFAAMRRAHYIRKFADTAQRLTAICLGSPEWNRSRIIPGKAAV